MINLYFLTLFPAIIDEYFSESIMKRALEDNIIRIHSINIRDFANNKHNRVDDYPYGGGAGMVMQAPPIIRAIKSIEHYQEIPIIFLTPSGTTFNTKECQKLTLKLKACKSIIFLCGHYEGVDQRVIDRYVTDEYSIGDYVLTGGELPALVLADSIIRHIQGVLGNAGSLTEESFESNLLEYPQYTRPQKVEDMSVPEVLLSGNHAQIKKWRKAKSLEITQEKRPDLLKKEK
ncbi:tRNA (guanosine(37)-N1)-methyltransferase TrmD [Eubacteriaceae bacterium RF-744-FAT-4]|uniref:tRNA (guanine-N(1)-)-methyltransferase n=1 Tax=Pseudoramibacter porci TaxID=2606631 RepID=A0A7X2TAB6_9FIRM|nr:tRNA (guanosine(37)-N1)-methyltransferase TrmD [Pseudoramibacter porci]